MVRTTSKKLTLIVDPRFSGGTSSAVAREILVLAPVCDLSVVALGSKLFKGQTVHPLITEACEATQTPLTWDPPVVSADVVALHNPTFLKFNQTLGTRIVCDRLFVVCHENFLRPDGPESFDVAHCLGLISKSCLSLRKYLAPVSGWNRTCAKQWMATHAGGDGWQIAPLDWTNICDFPLLLPAQMPQDRRGRHSRPGLEKFPSLADMKIMFPEKSKSVRLLGADSLLEGAAPAHWDLLPFGAETVDDFLQTIDFFVYFTHPFLQESFGRVIGEALAAGKVVITSKATGATFGDGVVTATPQEVDQIIAKMIANPALYKQQALRGQKVLANFGAAAFQSRFHDLLDQTSTESPIQPAMEKIYDFL